MSETTLGAEMRKARGNRSLREMGVLTGGISFSLLARIEQGKVLVPSRETLYGISRGYGIPLETLAQLVYLGGNTLPARRNPAEALAAVS